MFFRVGEADNRTARRDRVRRAAQQEVVMTNTDSTTTRARASTPIERVLQALRRVGAEGGA